MGMRILHVLGNFALPRVPDDAPVSGVVRAALEIAKEQAKHGHEVWVVTVGTNHWEETWQRVKLVQLRHSPWARLRVGKRSFDFSIHLPLVKLTQRHKFDVIHGHLYYYLRFFRAKVRLLQFQADPFHGVSAEDRALSKAADFSGIGKNSDAQIAVSHFIAKQLLQGLGERASVKVIHNAVNHEQFNCIEAKSDALRLRESLGISRDATAFLYAGTIVPEKGVLQLAKAFRQLADEGQDVDLIIAGGASLWDMATGEGSERTYEKDVFEVLQPLMEKRRAHGLGRVSSADMVNVYAACDVVVVPSIWTEAFGMVALEGLASGKPIIASDTGGLPEFVNSCNGALVPPGDEAALYTAMRDLANDPELRRKLGEQARQSSLRFSWKNATMEIERLYEQLLARRG
jgi:glycosyltransferase involved in cell wall biosynthesis